MVPSFNAKFRPHSDICIQLIGPKTTLHPDVCIHTVGNNIFPYFVNLLATPLEFILESK